MNVWRFLLGVLVGVVISLIVMAGMPFKWNADPDRQTINKSHDRFIIIIGTDESMDFLSQYRVNSHDGEDRIIHIFRKKEDAEKARKHLTEAWNSYTEGKK